MEARNWNRWRSRRAQLTQENLKLYGDYRPLLVAELERRKTLSPHYSLRDFAKDIEISPSHLSRILKGERGLSRSTALKVAAALGLRGPVVQRFLFHVQAISARSIGLRFLARSGLSKKWNREAEVEFSKLCEARPTWKEQARQAVKIYPRDFALDRRLKAVFLKI